ncbi:MAG: hypothetical protein GTO55_07735 [Armatimonadetes bacterium]|nr:hypothetical protein [Armatimonadota bacterium]NIM24155.1 hypothetical protein [Armatimonadota bacterium]NIM68014.1 hypothetical protein [Armatimonadota bacterium]NIM76509.1 hypothetical protein [Armatimonadota bacterium]NIN06248.1 hypothetical protein [Armatimonadota bacterium]
MYALAVVLAAAIIGVLILLALEIRQWTSGRHFISRRRFVLRIIAGLALMTLLAGVFVGITVLRLTEPTGRPLLFLGYWLGCLLIAMGLVVVALAEMREVKLREKEREHEIWRDIASLIANQTRKKKE